MINHNYKFIFIHIHKTGGTSLEKVFEGRADQADVELKHEAMEYYRDQFPVEFDTYFSFSTVRNTWDWLVSRYHWNLNVDSEGVHWPMRKKLFDYPFEEFAQRVCDGADVLPGISWMDRAVRPQIERISVDGKIAVNFVARFEHLQRDFDVICENIGHPKVCLPHVYRSKHEHYSSYYSPELRDSVAERFKADIEAFGFVFEDRGPD